MGRWVGGWDRSADLLGRGLLMRRFDWAVVGSTIVMLVVAAGVVVGLSGRSHSSRPAAAIIVNSPGDVVADDGLCTLREAITAANTSSPSGLRNGECRPAGGRVTIAFAVSGGGDFIVDGAVGYSFRPLGPLPDVLEHGGTPARARDRSTRD